MQKRVLFGKHPFIFESILSYIDRSIYDAATGDLLEEDLDRFDFVVPLTLPDYFSLVHRQAEIPVRAVIPSEEAVRLCNDKLSFNRFMLESGFGQHIPPLIEGAEVGPPFILKRREDEHGFNSEVIRTEEDYVAARERVDSDQYFKQTYIEGGTEYCTHMFLQKGKVTYQNTVKYEMIPGDYVKGHYYPPTSMSWQESTPAMVVLENMLKAVGFSDGTCNIDYKVVGDTAKVFEINPRFGGSLPYDINRYLAVYEAAL